LVVFMFGLHELTISSLLHGPGTTTMAVHVLNFQQLGEQATMAALAVLLTAGAALVTVPVVWLWRRTGPAAPV
jgi:iron(III) transport system permease protein